MKYIDSRKVGCASTRPPRRFHRNRPTGQMNLFYCRFYNHEQDHQKSRNRSSLRLPGTLRVPAGGAAGGIARREARSRGECRIPYPHRHPVIESASGPSLWFRRKDGRHGDSVWTQMTTSYAELGETCVAATRAEAVRPTQPKAAQLGIVVFFCTALATCLWQATFGRRIRAYATATFRPVMPISILYGARTSLDATLAKCRCVVARAEKSIIPQRGRCRHTAFRQNPRIAKRSAF